MSFEHILQKYISTFPSKIEVLKEAYDTRNILELHDLLHKLAGSSGGYGYDRLCKLSHQGVELTNDVEKTNLQELNECLHKIYQILNHDNM